MADVTHMKRVIATLLLTLSFTAALSAREGNDTTSFLPGGRAYSQAPASHIFEIFRPNYFIAGLPTGDTPTKQNCDVKFQVSLKCNLWRGKGRNQDWDIFAGYSQISVWNLFAKSSPFYDNTYIPGFYVYHPMRNKAGEITNAVLFGYEHRSNGRDDVYSRSLNYLFATYSHFFPCNLMLGVTGRFGAGYYGEQFGFEMFNRFEGYVTFHGAYTTPKRIFELMFSVTPIWNSSIANVTAEAAWCVSRKLGNPQIFLQYHYGYDEAQRDCCLGAAPKSMLRFGISFTPHTMMRAVYY